MEDGSETETGNNAYHHCVLCDPISRLNPRYDLLGCNLENYLIMHYIVNYIVFYMVN